MQTRVVTKVTISASKADVFEYLSHLKYHHLWNPQIQKISSMQKLSLGTEYSTTSVVLGVKIRAKNVVTVFEEAKELELENKTGTVKYKANFKLTGRGKSTTLTCTTTVSSESEAFYFAKPILKVLARRELQADMQALKLAAEHKLPAVNIDQPTA